MANILGVSAYYHDSSAALVRDGTLVAACAEDRFTRVKHDSTMPENAMQFCLDAAGLQASELDAVVFYERPEFKFIRVLSVLMAGYPGSARAFAQAISGWISEKLWVRMKLSARLDLPPDRVRFVEHHESHAACAFYTSPFEAAAILTLDGVGEATCGSISRASRNDGVETIERTAYPHSLGLVYAAMTGFLGFQPNDGECSTMALAAFGEPTESALFERILPLAEDGRFEVDTRYFDFTGDEVHAYPRRLREALGAPREDAAAGFCAFEPGASRPPGASHEAANIAASLQARTEAIILAQAERARRLTGLNRLCLAGGVAYNAVAVGRLIREAGFEAIFIPPDPGDGGAAAGAALRLAAQFGDRPPAASPAAIYSGPRARAEPLRELLPHLAPQEWRRFALDGVRALGEDGLEVQEFEDRFALCAHIAERLAAGAIIGWVQGRAEFGPRALGARSILCDPANLEVARRLSARVKRRAAFRPYALSVAQEDAPRLFDAGWQQPPCRWMQATLPVRQAMRERVRAALHVDGTTRPQVCSETDNPAYHALLQAFGAQTGLAALLNTSLNDSGEPLAATAEEALLIFARTDMDILVVENLVISKKGTT